MHTPENQLFNEFTELFPVFVLLLRCYAEQKYGPRAFSSLQFFDRQDFAGTTIGPYIAKLTETEWRTICSMACAAETPSQEASIDLRVYLLQKTSLAPDQVEKIIQN